MENGVVKSGVIKCFIIKRDFRSTQDYLVKSIWNIGGLLAETKISGRTSHYGHRTAFQYCTSPSEIPSHNECAQRSKYSLDSFRFARPCILYTLQTIIPTSISL